MLILITSISFPVGKSPRKNTPLGESPMVKVWDEIICDWGHHFFGGLRAEWGMGFWIFLGHIETFQLGWGYPKLYQHPLSVFMIDHQSLTIDSLWWYYPQLLAGKYSLDLSLLGCASRLVILCAIPFITHFPIPKNGEIPFMTRGYNPFTLWQTFTVYKLERSTIL